MLQILQVVKPTTCNKRNDNGVTVRQVPKSGTYNNRNIIEKHQNDVFHNQLHRREMNHMSLRYSFFAIVPDGIIEIPQDRNLSWLTLFYALPKELVEKYPSALTLPRNIYELLDNPDSMEVIKNDMFLLLVCD